MRAITLLAAVALFAIVGCEKKSTEATRESGKTPSAQSHSPDDGHDHGGKDGHDDHDHDAHHGHSHSAEDGHNHGAADAHDDADNHNHTEHELGPATIGGFSVRAVQHGEIVAGKEIHVDVFINDSESKVIAVRAWIGAESGKGALKTKITINKNGAHNHLEAPSPLPADAKVCVELELNSGEKVAGSLLPKK